MNYLLASIYSLLSVVLILNYLSLNYKKTAIEIVNEMGIGYNLGKTFNCCDNLMLEQFDNNQIKLWGTVLPTKKTINRIKKYGFKTIRFQVTYMNFTSESNIIDSNWITGIKEIIDWIISSNLYCIFSVNHGSEFWKNEQTSVNEKYSNFWKQIANEFKDYDEHLIFETMNEIDILDLNLLEHIQIFVDEIRNSGGKNEDRLLIIPEMFTETEIEDYYYYSMPIEPSNKTAISIHYFFHSELTEYNDINSLSWYFKYFDILYPTVPLSEWGSEDNYREIKELFEVMKNFFIDKGIPVIIDEAAILNKYNNNIKSFREFIYVLFSLSSEYDGILSCLWDNPLGNKENLNFYNKELDKWNDEIIKDKIYKISKGKSIKSSEYYVMTNKIKTKEYFGLLYIKMGKKKVTKICVNVRLSGKLGIDVELVVISFNENDPYIKLPIKKENAKKQYDGTTIIEIDVSKEDNIDFLYIMIEFGDEYVSFNNATVEFEEYFSYFDTKSYKNDVLNDIYK